MYLPCSPYRSSHAEVLNHGPLRVAIPHTLTSRILKDGLPQSSAQSEAVKPFLLILACSKPMVALYPFKSLVLALHSPAIAE